LLSEIKDKFHDHVMTLQDKVCVELKNVEPVIHFREDTWERKDFDNNEGGGGRTRIFEGEIIENAGVNTSLIYGKINPKFAEKIGGDGDMIWATGISLIVHPRNPRVPTVHANFRMIHQGKKYWFGGGCDLTPYYPYPEDFRHFHGVWKKALDPYGQYQKMKDECDKYFVNHHRIYEGIAEARGIGGFFFDHYSSGDIVKDYSFVEDVSKYFIESYIPIFKKRVNEEWEEEDEEFLLHRRGRYVEFNLLHDKGTLFGLKTNGRIESILISLPGRCSYKYDFKAKKNSPQEEMMSYYRPRNWT